MRKTFLIFVILFSVCSTLLGQKTYIISGELVNRKERAVPFANVVLYNQTDSLMVKGTTSDNTGQFKIIEVAPGNYYLSILFIGFEPTRISDIRISTENINLNKIELKRKRTQLEEITVVSEKGMFENQAGKMVYNVDGNIAASGELADELLQNIPSVSVDMDNKVTVRGAKATLLIDGIESGLAEMLDQIPADAISSIEVITNPSVRYDSKKGGSIINIKLKKQAGKGYNGKLSAGIGTSEKRDFNLNLGQTRNGWRYSGAFNHQHKLQELTQNSERFTEKEGVESVLKQNQRSKTWSNIYFGNANAARFFKDKSFVSFKYTLQKRNQNKDSESLSNNYRLDNLISKNELSRLGENNNTFHQLTTNFKNNLDKGALEGGIIYSYNTPDNWYAQTSRAIDIETGEPRPTYREDEKDYENTNQLLKSNLDFSHKLSAKTNVETGVLISYNLFEQDLTSKRTYYTNDVSANEIIGEEIIESQFTNQNYSSAIYALISTQFKKYSVSAGTRLEYLHNKSESDSTVSSSYFKLIPSVHLKKEVSEKYSWEASFTARTTPPTYRQLNPISISFGNYNKSSGNPNLNPEYFYQFEWSNRWKLEKSNYVATLFFRNQTDIIGRWYFLEYEDGKQVSHSQFENLGELRTLGIDFSSMLNFGKLKIRPSLVTFYSNIEGNKFASTLDRNEVSYTLKIAGNYQLSKKVNFQCTANYNSPFISEYGKQYAWFKMDAGVRAKILKNKAAVSLKVSDVFDSYNYDKTINQREDMLRKSHTDPKSFLVYANFSYQFNSLKKGVKKGKKISL